jgi:hypothetical protein
MFTDMDKIDDSKIMMNTMNYNQHLVQEHEDDEVIVLQPNQMNVQGFNNSSNLNLVEKLVLLALMLFGRHYLNIHF